MNKIVHIIDTAKGGGAEHVALDIIRNFSNTKAFVLSCTGQHIAWKGLSNVTYATDNQKYKFRLQVVFKLYTFLLKERPDLIHVHLGYSLLLVLLVRIFSPWLYGTTIVYHEHGEILYNRKVQNFMKHTKFLVDRYIAVSRAIMGALQEIGINDKRIILLPNVLAGDLVNAQQIERNTCNVVKVGVVGRLEFIKGGDIAIKAFGQLNQNKFELHFFGTGSEESNYRRLADENGVNVHFHGYVNDRTAVYQSIDVLLIPSRSESSSLVMAEALFMGLPVIANTLSALLEFKEVYPKLPVTFYDGSETDLYEKLSDLKCELIDVSEYRANIGRNREAYFIKLKEIYS